LFEAIALLNETYSENIKLKFDDDCFDTNALFLKIAKTLKWYPKTVHLVLESESFKLSSFLISDFIEKISDITLELRCNGYFVELSNMLDI
jgi:hypothetical protein